MGAGDEGSSAGAHTRRQVDLYEEEVSRISNMPRVVIISGLSGSGKSTALKALEDVGFFCIDNMPVPLLPRVLELASSHGEHRSQGGTRPYAFVIDSRERDFLSEAGAMIAQLRSEGTSVKVIFLEAEDDVLVRRYSETRRRHPTSQGGTVREGIEREREMLSGIRERADVLLDTTELTVHALKARVQELVSEQAEATLNVTLMSFGFKYGLPPECDLVFDVRFLPNPYFVDELRPRTGLESQVADYVMSFPEAARFVELANVMLDFSLPLYEREGKTYLTIGVGCTGGKHRSVAIIEVLASRLRGRGWSASTRHRDRLKTSSAS